MARLLSTLLVCAALGTPAAALAQVTAANLWDALPTSAVLLDAGEGPTQTLRYDFSSLQPNAIHIAMSLQAEMNFDGVPPTGNALPVIAATNRVTSIDLLSHSAVRLHFTLSGFEVQDAPGVEPRVVEQMRGLTAPLDGITGSAMMSDRGELSEFAFDLNGVPEATVASLGDLLENFRPIVIPLPEEAIGVGGQFAVAANVNTGGYVARQTTIYTVTGLSDDGATLTATQSYSATHQPNEQTADLEWMLGTGEIDTAMSRTTPLSAGELSSSINVRMTVAQGRGATLVQTTTLTVTSAE